MYVCMYVYIYIYRERESRLHHAQRRRRVFLTGCAYSYRDGCYTPLAYIYATQKHAALLSMYTFQ